MRWHASEMFENLVKHTLALWFYSFAIGSDKKEKSGEQEEQTSTVIMNTIQHEKKREKQREDKEMPLMKMVYG